MLLFRPTAAGVPVKPLLPIMPASAVLPDLHPTAEGTGPNTFGGPSKGRSVGGSVAGARLRSAA